MNTPSLRKTPLSQLRSQLFQSGSINSSDLRQLADDPRVGARQLAHILSRKAQKEQEEKDRLLIFERELWKKGHTAIAGIDEAGRGPLAGPVVAASVMLQAQSFIPGVKDSKKVSARTRERLYDEIMRTADCVGIGIVDEKEIDRTNILAATYKAMHIALDDLSVRPQCILVDGRELPQSPCYQKAIIGGDGKCFSIAAASIVAKVTRDRIMLKYDDRFPEYGFAKHKGYATIEHRAALEKHGPCDIHRRSFSWKKNGS